MKKFAFILFLCCTGFHSFSQQRFPEQWVLNLSGSYLPQHSGGGFQVNCDKFIGRTYNFFHLGFQYYTLKFNTSVKSENVKSHSCLFLGGYGYSLEKFIPTPFYVNLSAGGVLGYEYIQARLKTSILNAKSKFIYSLFTGIQLESIVYKNFNIFLEPKIQYIINSDVQDFNFVLQIGIKFYL